MSFLGTVNPNIPQQQSVVSHNNALRSHGDTDDDTPVYETPSTAATQYGDREKSEEALTLQEDNEEKMEARVGDLARRLTRQSTRVSAKGALENPFFVEDPESTLNPDSPNFKPRDWLKMLLAIRSRDPEQYPDRTAGVAFKNLNVHGFGSPTDYQKDVLNSILEIGTIVRKLMGIKMQKIQILREFDGLVKSGEMLVVLGRPGSGCSTFLKTISGEMNGIQMSDDSTLNYQGMHTQFPSPTPHSHQLSFSFVYTNRDA